MVYGNGEIATNAHVVTTGEGDEIQRARPGLRRVRRRQPGRGEDRRPRPQRRHRAAQGRPAGPDAAAAAARPSAAPCRSATPVAAIGSPFGEKQSLSVGVVSAVDRAIDSLTEFQISGAIQTDAAINPGNSGGPLVDGRGRVIGVNQQIKSRSGGGEGVGFAVPADVVQRSLDGLRADGEVRYAYLGVQSVAALPAARRPLRPPGRARARGCRSSSPAARATKAGAARRRRQDAASRRGRSPTGGDIITRSTDRRSTTPTTSSEAVAAVRPGPEGHARGLPRRQEARRVELELGERPLNRARHVRRVRGVALDLAHALREIVRPAARARVDGRAHARDGRRRGRDVRDRRRGRGVPRGLGRGQRARRGVLLRGPRDGLAGRRAGVRARSSTRSTARGRRWRGWRRRARASRSRRSVTASRRWATSSRAAVVEIKSGEWFAAARGEGCRASRADRARARIRTSSGCSGSTASRAGPARPVVEVIGELIDRSSLGGGVFDLGSATFDLTRILTGQLDAYVEPGAAHGGRDPGHARGVRARRRRPRRQQLALRPRGRRAVPRGGRRGHHRRARAGRSRPTGCSAPDRSSTSPAWRPLRPPSIGCFSRPWNGAWSAYVRWISWPRLNPDQEGSPKCFSPSRWPIRAWPTTPTSSAARSSRRSASSPSR